MINSGIPKSKIAYPFFFGFPSMNLPPPEKSDRKGLDLGGYVCDADCSTGEGAHWKTSMESHTLTVATVYDVFPFFPHQKRKKEKVWTDRRIQILGIVL